MISFRDNKKINLRAGDWINKFISTKSGINCEKKKKKN